MAVIYLDSNATGADDGTSWTDAFTTLEDAFTAWSAGDVIWMAHNHSETFAGNKTFTHGNNRSFTLVKRMNTADDTYAGLPSSPNISVTGVATLTFSASVNFKGVYLDASSGYIRLSPSSTYDSDFEDCYFRFNNILDIQSALSRTVLKNCSYEGLGVGSIISIESGYCYVIGGKTVGTNFNTFSVISITDSINYIEGMDLSSLSSGQTIFSGFNNTNSSSVLCRNCLFPSSYVLNASFGINSSRTSRIVTYSCNDTGDIDEYQNVVNTGSASSDTGVYFDNGFSFQGSTPLSIKMAPVTSPGGFDVDEGNPLEALDVSFNYNGATGSPITASIEIIENYTVALNANEAWMEVLYMGTASETLWTLGSTRDLDGTPGSIPAGSGLASWTGEPAGSRSKVLSLTFTPQVQGVYKARVFLSKFESGKVMHYNPQVSIT